MRSSSRCSVVDVDGPIETSNIAIGEMRSEADEQQVVAHNVVGGTGVSRATTAATGKTTGATNKTTATIKKRAPHRPLASGIRLRRKVGMTTISSRVYRPASSSEVHEGVEDVKDNGELTEEEPARRSINVSTSGAAQRPSSPCTALLDDVNPNLYLGTSDPLQEDSPVDVDDPKVASHQALFYEQIELHYKTTNNRAMMNRNEMDQMVQLIKSNVKSKNASQYKMKRDFAVVTFGQHYSVIRRRDVTDKVEVDISNLPRYCCDEDLFIAIRKCHIDQEGHSGIR